MLSIPIMSFVASALSFWLAAQSRGGRNPARRGKGYASDYRPSVNSFPDNAGNLVFAVSGLGGFNSGLNSATLNVWETINGQSATTAGAFTIKKMQRGHSYFLSVYVYANEGNNSYGALAWAPGGRHDPAEPGRSLAIASGPMLPLAAPMRDLFPVGFETTCGALRFPPIRITAIPLLN